MPFIRTMLSRLSTLFTDDVYKALSARLGPTLTQVGLTTGGIVAIDTVVNAVYYALGWDTSAAGAKGAIDDTSVKAKAALGSDRVELSEDGLEELLTAIAGDLKVAGLSPVASDTVDGWFGNSATVDRAAVYQALNVVRNVTITGGEDLSDLIGFVLAVKMLAALPNERLLSMAEAEDARDRLEGRGVHGWGRDLPWRSLP